MPSIQNVERRGAVYYWRRTLRFQDGKSLVLRISLRTTDQAVARRMACAMTTKSETLRITTSQDGLTIEQKNEMFRKAMASMRDELDRNHVQFQRTEPDDAAFMIEGLVDIYEAMLRDFVVHGIPPNAGTRAHVEDRFADLPEDHREAIMGLFELKPRYREESDEAAGEALDRIGVAQDPDSVAIARKVMLEGKLAAAMEFRRRMRDPMAMWSQVSHVATAAATAAGPVVDEIAEPWASMTPTQAASRFILDNPKVTGDAKRKARWTTKTRSQFESSARLLEKSWGTRPMHLLTRDVVVALNDHFSRLPISHHKSPRHDPMTLEQICAEAASEVRGKKRDVATIGLGVGTTNRHFLFLKELAAWVGRHVPSMAVIDWNDFIYEDDRSARDQRDAYTEDEGRALFRLPIWVGAESSNRRLKVGTRIFHDAGYWVPIIAWYTGLRREEICQLTLADVTEQGGIWALAVTDENGGRVKNSVSMRVVPVADEPMRLGFAGYVDALRRAGETMLFPELRTESGRGAYGDVYYKMWWTKIAKLLPFIEPGQAVHSFRHTVTNELKRKKVFLESRADLIGHSLGGETAGRYSKATHLPELKEVVEMIPKVTDRLKSVPIQLLPPHQRAPRPARRPSTRSGRASNLPRDFDFGGPSVAK